MFGGMMQWTMDGRATWQALQEWGYLLEEGLLLPPLLPR